MGKRLEQTLAVLNGWLGDYLSRTQNGLALDMTFRRDSAQLQPDRAVFAAAYPNAKPRVVVLLHGLMCTEDNFRMADGSDYGSLLERDLGFSAVYIRYNTGLPIAENGAQLDALLQRLLAVFPVPIEELLLVGYSMGGLLVRSASHVAAARATDTQDVHAWLKLVQRVIYVGTPHLGAPAERMGKLVSEVLELIPNTYTQLVAELANTRSAGLKDLGHADLRREDRELVRNPWALQHASHPVPLLPNIAHYLIAGSMFTDPRLALLFGDTVVPLVSATFGKQEADALIPPERVKVIPKLSHVALAHHPDVYAALRAICEEAS
ncbi:MAG: hypothetical protein RL701_2337 [Pseudomonadota bacterium]|jgi:pimeloyl-ACP methyl ester carboxylesterase